MSKSWQVWWAIAQKLCGQDSLQFNANTDVKILIGKIANRLSPTVRPILVGNSILPSSLSNDLLAIDTEIQYNQLFQNEVLNINEK